MAFDTLQVEAVEGLASFTNTIGHRSTGVHYQHGMGEKERYWVVSKMNNLKRNQQPHVTKVTFYSSSEL